MLSEERVILMTRMASYESDKGKKNVQIGNFFRSDYVTIQVLKSIICSTVAFFLGFGLYILYDFEIFMQDLYKLDLLAFGRNILMYYAVTVVSYAVLVYVGCTIRYTLAKKGLKRFYQNLKKLNSLYSEQK